jgi:hypothetical protein
VASQGLCILSTATRLWAGRSRVRIPVKGKDFYFLPPLSKLSRLTVGHTQPVVNGYWHSFLGVWWPGREVDHSPPSSAEVKNEWSHTSTPLIYLHYTDRDDFNYLYVF